MKVIRSTCLILAFASLRGTEINYHSGDFSYFLLDMALIKCKFSFQYSSGLLPELAVTVEITVTKSASLPWFCHSGKVGNLL